MKFESHRKKGAKTEQNQKKFRSCLKFFIFFQLLNYEGAISMEGLVWLSTVQFLVYTFGQGSNEWFSTNGL